MHAMSFTISVVCVVCLCVGCSIVWQINVCMTHQKGWNDVRLEQDWEIASRTRLQRSDIEQNTMQLTIDNVREKEFNLVQLLFLFEPPIVHSGPNSIEILAGFHHFNDY